MLGTGGNILVQSTSEESEKLSLAIYALSKVASKKVVEQKSRFSDKVDIGFNSRYIIDICNEVDGDEIDINLLDSVSPAIILDKTDENLFFVLMPMRI